MPAPGSDVTTEQLEKMRANVSSMIESSDDREGLVKGILAALAKGNVDTIAMVQKGWTEHIEHRRIVVTNMGIVAALVASVTVGSALAPLELPDVEDDWTDRRMVMKETAQAFLAVSAILAILSTIMSLVWVNYSMIFVLDADDAFWFMRSIDGSVVDTTLVICLLCTSIGVVLGATIVNVKTASTVTFVLLLVLMALGLIWYITVLIIAKKHQSANAKRVAKVTVQVVREVATKYSVPLPLGDADKTS